MTLVLSVLSQQSKQKEQSPLHTTCSLFSIDQLQSGTERKKGGRGCQQLNNKGIKEKKVRKRKGKEKGNIKKNKEIKDTLKHSTGT